MKKNKPQANKAVTSTYSRPSLLQDKRFRIICGLFIMLFSVYLFFAFFSFLFTGGIDQSIIDKNLSEVITNPGIATSNSDGYLGALISDYLINRGFGIGSFIFCYIFMLYGLKVAGRSIKRFSAKIITSCFLIIWVSLFIGFLAELLTGILHAEHYYLFPGGAHGYFVSRWFCSVIGNIGTFFLLFIAGIALLFFGFENTFNRLLEATKQQIRNYLAHREKVAQQKAEAQAALDKEREKAIIDLDEEWGQSIDDGNENENKNENPTVVHPDEPQKETPKTKEKIDDESENDSSYGYDNEEDVESEDTIESQEPSDEDTEDTEDTEKTEEQPREQEPEDEQEEDEDDFSDSDDDDPEAHQDDDSIGITINQTEEEEVVNQNTGAMEDYDPTSDLSNYHYPPLDLLDAHPNDSQDVSQEELDANKDKIVETLRDFKIEITEIKATIGPTVTLYEIVPAPGVRISKIKNLEDDIALTLSALGIRIIAPIPGAGTIGIEVPNRHPKIVSMREIIASKKFQESKFALPVAIGRTISNETYTFDLAKMPHLLVAGATGQGKSVGLNAIITSLLYKKHPSQLKFVMVDPKKVELSIYSVIEKHYLAKLPDEEEAIITDVQKVINTLNSLCVEMDSRYDLLKNASVRNIKEYNEKFVKRRLNPEKGHRYLPYIVVIVDEFADLIMTAGKDIETPIARIAQLARAVGIHMIIATQRPSTNVITGIIKANFPARIAFKVASMIDSRTILDSPGANQLIGRGDMLISVNSETTRVQCAFVDTPEIDEITQFIASQQSYASAMELPQPPQMDGNGANDYNGSDDLNGGMRDPLFEEVAQMVVHSQMGSTSAIQRRYSIGYNRAGRIMDQLENAGIVGPSEGSKPRNVLIKTESDLEFLLRNL